MPGSERRGLFGEVAFKGGSPNGGRRFSGRGARVLLGPASEVTSCPTPLSFERLLKSAAWRSRDGCRL